MNSYDSWKSPGAACTAPREFRFTAGNLLIPNLLGSQTYADQC
jgi:hypothetical protein